MLIFSSCSKDDLSLVDSLDSARELYEELSNFTPGSILTTEPTSRALDINNRNFIAFSQEEIEYLSSLDQKNFVLERETLFINSNFKEEYV